jgi:hypothetical protein
VKRRQFISLIGGAAASWPLAARAQQPATLPTVGFLGAATPAVASPWLAAFVQRLRELGWVEGRNVTIEVRWAEGARVPTIHAIRDFLVAGGFMSYGPNAVHLFRRSADYVDKILRGAKPGDLPVEQPTKFDLVFNLTTARALGLEVPPTLLARADEVIE